MDRTSTPSLPFGTEHRHAATEPTPVPAPSPGDVPPEVQNPTPPESPVPTREPPVMPPPQGLARRYARASAMTR